MREPVVYIDHSKVREGKLEEAKAQIQDLVHFVEENEPHIIRYGFHLNDAGTRLSVLAIHPDSASLEFHLKIAGPAFGRFAELINLESIEVFGPVSATVMEQLMRKAALLGRGTVTFFEEYAGFARKYPPGSESTWGLAPGNLRG